VKRYHIHRLIALTFLVNKDNKKTVNHINWIKKDNRVINLEWNTYSENIKHAFKLWLNKSPKWRIRKNNNLSKKINQYTLKWDFIKTWGGGWDIKRFFWKDVSSVYSVCKWTRCTAYWFKWKYYINNLI